MCIDEFKSNSGKIKYQTSIADGKNKKIIDVVKSRYLKDLEEYFSKISKEERERVKMFVSNMSKTFKEVKKEFFRKSIHIIVKEEEKIRLAQMLEGNERIGNWCEQVEYVGEKEFKKVVKMLKNWLEEITNSFDYEYNNGYLEGKHNKIKTLKRVSFRMDNFESFRNRILLT